MEAPPQIRPSKLADYLEVMCKSVFQTGISWKVIENKWPGIREALHDFEPLKVASITEAGLAELTQDTRVIRNRRKLEAIIDNARLMLDLEEEHGGFRNYLRFHGGFEATVKDLCKRFRFLGETGSYVFLYVVREKVPPHEEWMASRNRRQPK